MNILGINILTGKKLQKRILAAKSEQRQLDIAMLKKMTHDYSVMAYEVRRLRAKLQENRINDE